MKKFVYYALILLIIVGSNTGILESLLDAIVGVAWSKTIVDFLKLNTQGLIIILLLSIYLEYIREDPKKLLSKNTVEDLGKEIKSMKGIIEKDYWTQIDSKSVLKNILQVHYGNTSNVSNLISIITPQKCTYSNVSVLYELNDINDKTDLYQLKYQLRFRCNINEYLIAFVTSAFLQDKISAVCDKINDVFSLSDKNTMDDALSRISSGESSFRLIRQLKEGPTEQINYPIKKIERSMYPNYLDKIDTKEYENIQLFSCKINDDLGGIIGFIVSYNFTMRKDDHYCYWVADRPMYLENLTFNATNFSMTPQTKFVFQPFVANFSELADEYYSTPAYHSIDIHNWIVKGQGVILTWR